MSDPTRTQHAPATGADAESRAANDATQPRAPGTPGVAFGPPAHAGEVGTLGRYRVLKQLGAGGMGAVYLGYHTGLQCKVALKVMLQDAATDSAARDRFLREARTAAQVKSDHVVTIHDVDEANGVPFIAMEYLHGVPLDAYLTAKGELPLGQAVRIARECALGLAAVHAQGLIHRDIKPANVWLEAPNGRAKLLDFGLARAETEARDITGTGGVVGTVRYMSPQQGRGEFVDARADLWSLGVVLYRLCTGRMPFDGQSQMAVLTSIAVDVPTAPRTLNASLPLALEAVILKLLAKDPAARFQTAHEVVAALAAVERGDGPQVVPVSQSLPVSAPTENVWESIADDSESFAVPLTDADATEATRAAPPRRASKLPLFVGAGMLVAALVGLVAVVLSVGKKPNETKKDDPPPEPTKGRLTIAGAERETEFALKRDGIVVQKTRSSSIQLEPGRYTIEFASPVAPGTKIDPDTIDVRIGGSHRVAVIEGKGNGKVYPLPQDLIAPMTPVKPEKVFTLDHLDPTNEKHVPADERYEWQPKELVALLGSHRQRVPGGLTWVRTSPDAAFALVGDGAGASWRIDLNTGRVTDDLPIDVVSADFRRGAAGNKLFDLTNSKAAPVVYPRLGEVRAFLGDDIVLALQGGTYAVRKLDGKGGAEVVDSFTQPEVVQFAVSPDGKYLALVFKDETCRVYDISAGFQKDKFVVLPGPKGRTLDQAVTFSYTGRMSTWGRDGTQVIGRVWDVSGKAPILFASGLGGTLTGDGKYLFKRNKLEEYLVYRVGSDAKPLSTGRCSTVGGSFVSVSSSRDGSKVVAVQEAGVIRVWQIEHEQGTLKEPKPVQPQPLLFGTGGVSPDGKSVILFREGERTAASVLNLSDFSRRELREAGEHVRFGPSGSALITSGNGGDVRGTADFAAVVEKGFTPHCFSPDGKWLAGTSDTELRIWDVSAMPPKLLWKVPGINAQRADFTPDGRFLIARRNSGNVRVWALTASGPKLRYETDAFTGTAWDALSPDGRTLAVCEYAGSSCLLCLYDIEQGVPKGRRVLAADLMPGSGEFSPNGRLLLVGDTNLKVFDATTGAVLYQPTLRGAPIGARWHPDGKHVFLTNADRTTYILRLPKEALAALDDPDRKAMEYVFSVGGALSVSVGGEARSVRRAAEVPAGALPYSVSLEYQKNVSPETLVVFRDCRRLIGFNAHSTDITDEALAHVAVHAGLKHLDLHVCPRVTDAGLAHFKNCKQIEHLNLAQARNVTDAGLAHFAGCAHLAFLDVRETKVTPGKVAEFAKALPNCKIVHDGGVLEPKPAAKAGADDRETAKYVLQVGGRIRARTATETVPVFKLEELPAGPLAVTYLELIGKDLSDEGWRKITRLRELTELIISGPSLTDQLAAHFECPNLELLKVAGTNIGDAGVASLVNGKKLRRIDVSGTEMSGGGLELFKGCSELIELNLSKTRATNESLEHIKPLKKLIWLHLNDTAITDAGLKHLEGLQALRQLVLKNTKVTEPALKALKLKLHPDCQIDWDKGTIKP